MADWFWGGATPQGKDSNTGISRLVEATAEYIASRASEEILPMPQSKLCLVARRLNHELDKISSDFATCSPPSRLAALRLKRRRLAALACFVRRKRDEHDWQGKLAETRAIPHVLHVAHLIIFWGVESRIHFSMGSWNCQCVAYQRYLPTVKTSRFLRYHLAEAETGLGKARARWPLVCLRSALLATPPPWQVWGGPGD